MRVVFLDDVDGVALAGDIKNVADGYARNFLLPRKLAAAATTARIEQAASRARILAKEQEVKDDAARAVAEKIASSPITLEAKVGEQGRLFGSITASDIAGEVSKLSGATVEHRQVLLSSPIKELGSHEIGINLTRNVRALVTVNVEPEGGAAVQAAAGSEVEAGDEPTTEDEIATEIEAAAEDESEPED